MNSGPSVVAMYHRTGIDELRKIAEFTLMPDGTAALTIYHPVQSGNAILIYQRGMCMYGGTSTATGENGPAFMRSLLEPRSGGTYTAFLDESTPPAQ